MQEQPRFNQGSSEINAEQGVRCPVLAKNVAYMPVHGDYYVKPESLEIRPEIVEKAQMIAEGKY